MGILDMSGNFRGTTLGIHEKQSATVKILLVSWKKGWRGIFRNQT